MNKELAKLKKKQENIQVIKDNLLKGFTTDETIKQYSLICEEEKFIQFQIRILEKRLNNG